MKLCNDHETGKPEKPKLKTGKPDSGKPENRKTGKPETGKLKNRKMNFMTYFLSFMSV